MDAVIQFGAALALLTGVIYLTRRRAYADGYTQGHTAGRSESAQLSYHRGHEDGLYEGRLKERMEIATANRKQYEQGWADALSAVEDEVRVTMAGEATMRLSA